MYPGIEHPEIAWIERTGYPSWLQLDEDDYDEDAYAAYCDRCYEEQRDKMLLGE